MKTVKHNALKITRYCNISYSYGDEWTFDKIDEDGNLLYGTTFSAKESELCKFLDKRKIPYKFETHTEETDVWGIYVVKISPKYYYIVEK